MRTFTNPFKRYFNLVAFIIMISTAPSFSTAQELVWRGFIPGNGQEIGPVHLNSGTTYFVEVSGSLYMGKWYQNNRGIINDPCYEFNAHYQPTPIAVLQNNLALSWSTCDRLRLQKCGNLIWTLTRNTHFFQ